MGYSFYFLFPRNTLFIYEDGCSRCRLLKAKLSVALESSGFQPCFIIPRSRHPSITFPTPTRALRLYHCLYLSRLILKFSSPYGRVVLISVLGTNFESPSSIRVRICAVVELILLVHSPEVAE